MEPRALGVGVVWCPELDALCRESEGLVDVIEAEPETFWIPTLNAQEFRSFLSGALEHLTQPKLLHGVGGPVGGTCPSPTGYLEAFARDVAALNPEYVSEHLSVTQYRTEVQGPPVPIGFMLPPIQSQEGVLLAAANISRHRAALGNIPLAVETPVSYLPPAPGEWPDGVFVAAVAETADCGILLDLHNALCNARNGRQNMGAFLDSLPLERIWELHLAGGESEGAFHLDSHSGLVEPELMELAADLIPRLPNLRSMNLEIMPERVAEAGLDAVSKQLASMKDLWNTRSLNWDGHLSRHAWPTTRPPLSDPEAWEQLLGPALHGHPEPAMDEATAQWWHGLSPSLSLYRMLVGEGRASAVTSAAPHTTRALLRARGGSGTRQIFAEFWRESPPGYTAVEEARTFLRFISACCFDIPDLKVAIVLDARQLAQLS
jgi:uncharacterized protein (UPF0276 family)